MVDFQVASEFLRQLFYLRPMIAFLPPHNMSQMLIQSENENSWNRHFILALLAGTRRNPFRQELSIIMSSNPFRKQQSESDKSF